MNTENNVNTLQEYINAKNNLESVLRRPGRFSTTEETDAMRLFYTASSKPSQEENIKNAIEAANSLPDTNEIKSLLIETINKLTDHYGHKETDEVQKEFETDTNIDEIDNDRLEKLEKENERFHNMLVAISDYEAGLFNDERQKTKSFDERKKELEDKIAELENAPVDFEIDEATIEREFTEANARINSLASRTGKDQTPAMRFYEAASGIPFVNNIIPALEKAVALQADDEIKQPLIDALVKLAARYPTLRDEVDAKLLNDKMVELGIKPYGTTSKSNTEIDKLKQELEDLEKERQAIIEKYKPMRAKINSLIEQVEKQLEELRNSLNNNDSNIAQDEVTEKEPKVVQQDNQEQNAPAQEESYEDKLSKLAAEGPLFVDTERRLDEKDQWLNSSNAANLGKLKEETVEPETEIANEEITEESNELEPKTVEVTAQDVEETNDIPAVKEDTLTIPRVIKSVKKVSIQTIEKVKSIDYKQKIKSAFEWMDAHKKASIAIATLSMVSGLTVLGASLNEHEQDMMTQDNVVIENPVNDEVEESKNEEVQVEQPKTAAEIADEAIQEALNGVLEGDSVYRTAQNAANDENPRNTTEDMRDNSWTNANAGAYYDENAQTLTRDEAEEKIASGEEVVVRYDNNGTPIGYVSIGKPSTDETGLSK